MKTTVQSIQPCLWLEDQAEAAASYYAEVFEHVKTLDVFRHGEGGMGKPGSVMMLVLEIEGQKLQLLNGGPHYKLTPAFSLSVTLKTQADVDRVWGMLLEGGKPSQCGWLEDRFGVSWQVIPAVFFELINSSNRAKAHATMQAMLKMVKLDGNALQAAYDAG